MEIVQQDQTGRKEEALSSARASVFTLVFSSVLGLTVLSLAVSVYLAASIPNPSPQVLALIEACSTTWKMGFGAVVALMSIPRPS